MSSERHDIWKVADALQMDLRAASAKLVELRAHLASIDLPDPSSVTCPTCGIKRPGPRTLAEHVHVSHDGPVPDHWLAIEERSGETGEAA
jgi:hypothetical protein